MQKLNCTAPGLYHCGTIPSISNKNASGRDIYMKGAYSTRMQMGSNLCLISILTIQKLITI